MNELWENKEREKLIGDLIRYILFADSHKRPIKREEMNKLVMKEYKSKRVLNQILEETKQRLLNIFGFELIPMKSSRDTTSEHSHSTTRNFRESNRNSKQHILIFLYHISILIL